jgi:translation initiation factor IF-3
MKVKVNLRFRGREMAHTEIGFSVIKRFVEDVALFGHPDFQPRKPATRSCAWRR